MPYLSYPHIAATARKGKAGTGMSTPRNAGRTQEGGRRRGRERKPARKSKLQTTKEEIPNSDELAAQNRAAGQTQGQRPQITETIVREKPKIGRNERVTIKNVMSGESKTVKFKQAEPLIDKGEWVLVND